MTPAEFEQWTQGNGSGRESYHANRINYVFVTMKVEIEEVNQSVIMTL